MRILGLAVIALSMGTACFQGSQMPALATLGDASDVAWDAQSILRDDFDCDGASDIAALGRRRGHVVVGVSRASGGPSELLEFAIGAGEQAAICAEPATLRTESQENPDESLEGFEASTTCKGFRLEGGECDAIHFYWNRKRQSVAWWRN
jgi:hypothetical protein